MNLKFLILIAVFLALVFQTFSQDKQAKISGKITGDKNQPLNAANVVIEGTIDGATSDSTGYYEFETLKTGPVSLLYTALDYTDKRKDVTLETGKQYEVNIQLGKSKVETEEIIVTASSYTSGEQSQVTFTPLDIVRIPGSDADLYRAITTFPGSNQVDEGSRITVRGGDETEVLTVLDQASLYHPFIFDDDFNTASFTTINPWGLRGINFSSGGFSARYGNVLSAVLDLKSYEMPQQTGLFAWLGLAGPSLSGEYISHNKKFGASFEVTQTFLQPYFAINRMAKEDYNPIPFSNGAGGTLDFQPTKTSNLKIFFNFAQDKIGILTTSPTYNGFFNSNTQTYFGNLKYSTAIGSGTFMSAGLSYSNHNANTAIGVLNTDDKQIYSKFRVDLTHTISSKFDLNGGAEYEYNQDGLSGTVPLTTYDLALNSPNADVSLKNHSGRVGAYLEAEWKPVKRFFLVAGARTDYHTLSKQSAYDPRLTLGYKIAKDHTVRGAIGIYHQFPDLQYYDQFSNYVLKPQQATHYILGYEFNHDNSNYVFRIEGYYKDYRNLVLGYPYSFNYTSDGKGIAKGADVFLKTKLDNKFTGWISYSYTDSKRAQYDVFTMAPAKYDITHSLVLVGTYNINDFITTGFTYRVSTGKPYTPVVGATFDSTNNVYAPILGDPNSQRLPTYQRFDINLQFVFPLFGKFAVAVFQFDNLFNQPNLYGYTYNSNYTQLVPIVSTNRRQFYAGLGIQL